MTESKDKEKKSTLTLGSKTLGLGGSKGGQVPQVSRGRAARGVTVVTRKRRTIDKKSGVATSYTESKEQSNASGAEGSSLTDGERQNRLKVLQRAAKDEEDKKKQRALQEQEEVSEVIPEVIEEEEVVEVQEDVVEGSDDIQEPDTQDEHVAEKENTKEAKGAKETSSDNTKKRRFGSEIANINAQLIEQQMQDPSFVKPVRGGDRVQDAPASTTTSNFTRKSGKHIDDENQEERKAKVKSTRADNSKRRSNKLTITQALSGGGEERVRSLASVRRAREKARRLSAGEPQKEKEKVVREVIVPEVITVQELANRMAERVVDVTKALMKLGMVVTANQTIDADTAELVISEFGHNIKRVTDADVENVLSQEQEDEAGSLVDRAPVVTFMGHVDHGKTSLLDAIRLSSVAGGEAGGITQHIGAYQVALEDKSKITFLDTPGHEAFTAMRQRGANATDIVVLVVAADDGIMAQTVEAISHAKAAKVPIIVAINKVDKPEADPTRVRNALLEHELVVEELGGDILSVEVSAKQGTNLDKLLEAIMLQSEVLELKANPKRKAAGVVIEAKVDKGRGVVATLLVQKGTMNIGDLVLAGEAFGRVRAMMDASGASLEDAGPSVPVEVLGLDQAPEAGVDFFQVDTERQAREIIDYRKRRARDIKTALENRRSLEDLFEQAGEGGRRELPVIIKGDVQGSVEAITSSLGKLTTDEVGVRVLHAGAGAVTESDVTLANASHALVLGFNVRADAAAKELANSENVDIHYYSIIYDLVDEIKAILGGMLSPTIKEDIIGNAEIREVFTSGKKSGKIAGCYVVDGVIKRGCHVRLLRDNVVVHQGKLRTLRRFKDDVKEVGANFECGAAIENYDDIKAGDVIEAYELVEEARTLD